MTFMLVKLARSQSGPHTWKRAVALLLLLGFVKRNGSRQKLPVGTEQPNIVHAITRRANDNEQVRAYEQVAVVVLSSSSS